MKTVLRQVAWAVAVIALVLSFVACGGSPTKPTPPVENPPVVTPPNPGPTPVMAPPPSGVSAEVWRVAFSRDGKLRRPDAVHIILPDDATDAMKATFAAVVGAVNSWGLPTSISLAASSGATFVVSVEPGLKCNGEIAAGCTSPVFDSSGRITGGTMKFSSVGMASQFTLVMHEMIWTLGPTGPSPVTGITNIQPSGKEPTAEEMAMLRGRYQYPLLAVYSSQ